MLVQEQPNHIVEPLGNMAAPGAAVELAVF